MRTVKQERYVAHEEKILHTCIIDTFYKLSFGLNSGNNKFVDMVVSKQENLADLSFTVRSTLYEQHF